MDYNRGLDAIVLLKELWELCNDNMRKYNWLRRCEEVIEIKKSKNITIKDKRKIKQNKVIGEEQDMIIDRNNGNMVLQ